MAGVNVIGTRLRPVDDLARRLISEALAIGYDTVAHLELSDYTLRVLAVNVCKALVAQVTNGEWSAHDVHTVADMGMIRARPYVQDQTVRVEIWLDAFVAPSSADVAIELYPDPENDTDLN